jgi:dihydroorotate dehydrogenase electron transfer subunit
MKKYMKNLTVEEVSFPHQRYVLIKLTDQQPLPDILPGQFVEVKVDGAPNTFLRRPISVNYVDRNKNQLWLLIQLVGEGTRTLAKLTPGDCLNVVFPLGNGFSMPTDTNCDILLVGGGVGVAPLLYYGEQLKDKGFKPFFLLGARTKYDLLQIPLFQQFGEVFITTEDGSMGEKGFVTNHSVLGKKAFSHIACCGPKPMMMSVARYALANNIPCQVSLENMMACGLGACLCCVEKTVKGNVCVCKEGPVFDIRQLTWEL